MDFLELMKRRYATKKYQEGAKIPEAKIAQIEEILRLSPSSINSQPWLFTVISDQALKMQLAEHSRHNAEKVRDCSHLIVFSVYDSVQAFEEEVLPHLAEGPRSYYAAILKPLGEAAILQWLSRQVYISLGVLLSACAVMSIDSTALEGIDTAHYTAALAAPHRRVLFAAALGHRSCDDINQPAITPKSRRPMADVVKHI